MHVLDLLSHRFVLDAGLPLSDEVIDEVDSPLELIKTNQKTNVFLGSVYDQGYFL